MRCSKCNYKNIKKANFCRNCGNKFSKEEQDKAYQKTIYYALDEIKKWYERFTLSALTDNKGFRLMVLFMIFIVGLYYASINGTEFNIQKSVNYETIYNDKDQEYYLISKEEVEEVPIDLYIPKKTINIVATHFNNDESIIDEKSFELNEEIYLKTNNQDYYILKASYDDGTEKPLKIIIYNENAVSLDIEE